jgi:short-subunit dehydrogenase
MSFFKNKVVAITGGSEGIGKALIEALIPLGAKIATCARNYDKLYTLQLQYSNVMLHIMTCDVSNEQDCKRFIDSTINTFGGIDILVNNAGINVRGFFMDTGIDTVRKIMDTNFYGAVYCTKFALPSILERKGSIVGISSIAGYRGLPGRSGYSASKFALQGWMEAIRTELLHTGINIMWVAPGYTGSNIRQMAPINQPGVLPPTTHTDEEKMMPADECARYIIQAIEKRKRNLVLTLNGKSTVFVNKFFPAWADKLVHKFFIKDGNLIK